MAEAWLIAQDPYLKSDEFGQSIDEVENLIKKHEAFEKAAAAQEERFAALERLTTVSSEQISELKTNSTQFYVLSQLPLKCPSENMGNWVTRNLTISDNLPPSV